MIAEFSTSRLRELAAPLYALAPPCRRVVHSDAGAFHAFTVPLENPRRAPFALQVAASMAALNTIIAEYRGFVSYAQNL